MTVRRITANIGADAPAELMDVCATVLGLSVVMDHARIVSLATDLPPLSIEGDDQNAVLTCAAAPRHGPHYGPVTEPWGARRAYLRDPAGTVLNILEHCPKT